MLSSQLMPGAEQATATDPRRTTSITQKIGASKLFPQAAVQSSSGISPADSGGVPVYSSDLAPAPSDPMLFGVKRKYVYIGGGVLAGLVVLRMIR